ncbi:ferric reductase like transmembrane component-domain-containing protein [Leptodontidium sp. 2 PMI_412]|nr:ferric reductase like transmembrane component-domain-containing protein [Leptodontidium sp. 2 PMI_412]
MLLSYIFFLLSWTSIAWGLSNRPSDFCFGGCELALGIFTFNSTTPDHDHRSRAQKACDNTFQIPSLYLCLRIYCTENERLRGLDAKNETCRREAGVSLPPWEIVDQYGEEDVNRLRHLMEEDIEGGREGSLSEVVVLSRGLFRLAFDTLDAVFFEARIHNAYGRAMYYLWVVIIAIGLSSHLGQYLLTSRHHHPKWQSLPGDDEEGDTMEEPSMKWKRSIFDKPYVLIKRYVTVPATFGYKRSQNVGWCTIPTRVQSLAIGAFVGINIVLCSCSYRVFANNIYWPRVSDQILRYFADRTGIISTANLPLIWAFGIRNNTLLWLTGWDFATYNNFHRWVARVSTLEAVLHSLAYTVMIVAGEGSVKEAWTYYLTYYQQKYFVNGVLATILMVAILVASVYPLRRNFYEIFLWLHIVLSIFVIITMYYHVEIFRGYTNYIWPCVFIWVFDRAVRFLRTISFNLKFWNTKAVTAYGSRTNIVRIVVPYSSSFLKPRPGTFYYIYTLNSWTFWENHPFTLAYSTPELSDSSPSNSPSSSLSLGTIKTTTPSSSLTFIIRPYNGFTSRLRISAIHRPATQRVLIEGPYGETQPFHRYENVLFVVGGTGIAVPLSYLSVLLNGEARTRRVGVVWAVREVEFLEEVLGKDFSGRGGEGNVEAEVEVRLTAYITRRGGEDKDDEGEGMGVGVGQEISMGMGRRVKVLRGRPNVFDEVENAALEAGDESLAVVACGPGMMADDARRAVVEMLGRGYGRIEYFEESFNW